MPTLSILTSQYHAGPYVKEFYSRAVAAAEQCTDDIELVFVDDGSPDDGKAQVLELIESDPRVRLVELTRNFGQHRAILTGLEYTSGDYVFIVDSDLEEDPELDGVSLSSVLKKPDTASNRSVILPFDVPESYAVISKDWRYIRYTDGSEELYDLNKDPEEWYNLARN